VSEQKHTALPWVLEDVQDKNEGLIYWRISNKEKSIGAVEFYRLSPEHKTEAIANAKFAVRACNSHYDLLVALKKNQENNDASFHGKKAPHDPILLFQTTRKAIAKAERR